MYQKKIEMLMKEKKMTRRSTPNEGAVQILNGKMGSLATLISQYENAVKHNSEMVSRAMLYGAFHAVEGAWLYRVSGWDTPIVLFKLTSK